MQYPFKHLFSLQGTKKYLIKTPHLAQGKYKERAQELYNTFAAARIPFTLEVAMNHFGNELDYYVTLPSSFHAALLHNVQRIWPGSEVYDMHNQSVFSFENVVESAYINLGTGKGANVEEIFSNFKNQFAALKVLGEGAIFQLVCKPAKDVIETNIRLITSAESPFRAKELLGELSKALKPYKAVRIKNPSFMDQFSSHEFEAKQSLALTSEQLSHLFHL